MEIYLDTNIIIGWFKNMKKSIKRGEDFREPKKLEFLRSQDFKLHTSSLTKAEVFRYLKSDWGSKSSESINLWKDFIRDYRIIELKEQINIDYGQICDICLNVNLGRKTIINLIHLQFAKWMNLIFLSGDKPITDRLKDYFDNTMTYIKLRQVTGNAS